MGMEVLDLFSAAAGGWSLGMHRAGFTTIAACEFVDWRRALYQQNNPGVRIYDDVCTLTADQLVRDLGRLPSIVVGSPPCQDISSANTKGKGVEGERSGLFFEAVRIIGEVRPRWFALENSSNLRTRGADAVLAALEALGYACWAYVVRAGDIGANHERPRCWIIGCDLRQAGENHAAYTDDNGKFCSAEHAEMGELQGLGNNCGGNINETPYACQKRPEDGAMVGRLCPSSIAETGRLNGRGIEIRELADADQAGQADGCMVTSLRQEEISDNGRGSGWGHDGSITGQMGLCAADSGSSAEQRTDWSLDDFARHLQLDDGLSAWLAGIRIAVGGPRGTSAASLIVEAFGDAVVPQIPEAIGRAILRTERALAVAYGRLS